MAMLQEVGLKVKLDMYDVSVWNGYFVAPFVADSGPTLTQSQHDNATGDPVFTAFVKYATDGSHSMVRDPAVDALIAKATSATGDERTKLWKELFRQGEHRNHRRHPDVPHGRFHPRLAASRFQADDRDEFRTAAVADPLQVSRFAAFKHGPPANSGPCFP